MNKKRRISISVKMDLLLVSMILLVSAGLVAISYRVYSNRVNRLYYSQVERAANEAVGEIIPEMVINFWNEINSDEFRTVRAEAVAANDENIIRAWMTARPTFILRNTVEGQDAIELMTEEEILSWGSLWGDYEYMLRALRESMAYFDITVAYIQHDEDGGSWNLVDPVEDLFYIGTAEEPIDAFKGYGDNVYISPTIYHSAYGWLCTAIVPIIYGRDQIAVGTVGVDTDMNRIIESRSHYLVNSGMFVLGITILGILLSLVITRRIVIKPLQLLSKATGTFASDDREVTNADVIDLPIRSNDEIGDLYEDIRSMQTRIVGYTENLTRITAERERTETELKLAEKIQRGMLPASFPAFPDRTEFDLYASMDPAREVGGDFYDFFFIDDTHLAVLIADVSDKGIPAALFMMSSMIMIRYRSKQGGTPAEILTEINERICFSNKSAMFVTVWMGILDLESGLMT